MLRKAMSNCDPKASCGPVEVFAVAYVACIQTTCRYSDDLKIDSFVAGGPRCHFSTSVLHVGKFPYVHWHLGAKLLTSFLISTLIPLALNLSMKSHLRNG